MFEFHGWFALAETAEESDTGGLRARVEELQAMLDRLRWPTSSADLRVLNGEYFLVLQGLVNRARHEAQDVEEIVGFVATNLPGSYGLLWRRGDEQAVPPGPGAFAVTVVARGRVHRRLDPFLSPTRPTIED
jgi:hypothetical protein